MSATPVPAFTIGTKCDPAIIDGMKFYSASQFLNMKIQVDWLIEGYFHRGSLGLIVAPPKHNKTTFILALGGALSTGSTFLETPCKKSRVLFYCLEGGDPSLSQTAHDMKLKEEGDFFITTTRGNNLQNPTDSLRKAIIHFNPDIVFIDPMMKWHPFDERSYSKSVSVLGEYSDLAKENNLCIVFIHHSPKSSENGHDGVNGSVGIWGTVDSKLHFYSKNGVTYLNNDQRNAKDTKARAIYINREDGTVSFIKPPLSGPEERIRLNILSLLKGANQSIRDSEIKKSIEGKTETIIKILNQLSEEGLIHEIPLGGRGNPIAYQLVSNEILDACSSKDLMPNLIAGPIHTNPPEDDSSAFLPTKEELTDYYETMAERGQNGE